MLLSRLAVAFLAATLVAPVLFGQEADLQVTKSGPSQAGAGADVSYEVTVQNLGPDDAATVTLDDFIPAGMTFVSAAQNSGPAFNCTLPAFGDGGTINCTIAVLPSGSVATFTFVFNIPPTTAPSTFFTNIAQVSSQSLDPNDENNVAPAVTSTPAAAEGDVFVDKQATATAAGPGTEVSFQLTIGNAGPDAAENVTMTDILPGDLTFVSLNQTSGPVLSCTTPAVGAGGTITCTTASLATGAIATFTLTAAIPAGTPSGTTYTNTVTVDATNDPNDENDSSTATITVSSADVSIDKSGPATAFVGENVNYTLTVTNSGPDAATDVQLIDTIPAGTTFVSITRTSGPTASCTAPPVACTIALLPNGQTAVFSLVVHVDQTGTLTNSVTVATESFDSDLSDNSDSVETLASADADLAVTKSGPTTAVAGTNVTYTLGVTNNGPSPATGVALSDPIPAGTTFVSITQTSGPTFTCNSSVNCTIASLDAADTATFDLVLAVSPGSTGNVVNTATATSTTPDDTPANNSDTETTAVTSSADLAVTKDGPLSATAGTNVTYTIGVTNSGPSTAATVTLTDAVPAGTTFVSFNQLTGPAFTCDTTVVCTIATLAPATPATFELVVSVPPTATGPVVNTATITSATTDPVPANNTDTVTTAIGASADLAVTKSGPASATAGSNVTYTIGVSNSGPSTAATVTLTDAVPAGTTFVSFNQLTGPVFACDNTVVCTIATLAPAATATFELVVSIPPSVTAPVVNTATISSTTPDAAPANNTATVTTAVGATADLVVTKSGPASANAGTDITYTLSIANNGPSDATNVVLSDPIPAGTTFVSLSQLTGPTFACDNTINCTIATLVAGASATFELTLHVNPDAAGPISNTATGSSSTADPTPANSSSTTATAVSGADVAIVKTAPSGTFIGGSNITYTLAVTNNGPAVADDVTVTDVLPPGSTLVSASPSCTGTTTVTCAVGTLTSGATANLSITITLPQSGGPLVNTATVAATQTDPNLANNTSTATITVAGASAADIPTLSPWALALLALGIAVVVVVKR
ncbi:MAG TPA: DUF11 domain-containing protein [Thermoanaerobaculia bacterium]|jgi:uncharacterized repeat protein (TIGR01451 family)